MLQKLRILVRTNKFLSLLSSGTSAVLGLLTFSLLARTLPQGDFGFWGFFITAFTLFDMLRSGLLSSAMIKAIAESRSRGESAKVIGSGWQLSVWITAIGSVVVTLAFALAYFFTGDDTHLVVTQWFALMAFASIPHTLATWVLNAYLQFNRIFWVRFLVQGSFFIGVLFCYWFNWGLWMVFLWYFAANLLTTIVVLLLNWSKLPYWRYANSENRKGLLNFGKYSMGTLIGSNLLRSSDTFIIVSVLGTGANAVYMVAERLVGLFDIPLQALVSLAFPTLAKKNAQGDPLAFQREFELSAGFSSLLLLPISALTFLFADQLVVLLGGAEYIEAGDVLRFFAVYTALTPLDRFSGIALDVLHRPHLNFYKVLAMLAANVIGDIVVLQFSDRIVWVAFVSIITFATGILFGFIFLRDTLPFRPITMLKLGIQDLSRLVKKYVGK